LTDNPPLLALRRIEHSYGQLKAVAGVDIDVAAGQVHALIGENGAGKTTLVKIAAGQIVPARGEIYLSGEQVRLTSRVESAKLGIGVVHQNLSLLGEFSVAENLLLGRPGVPFRIDLGAARAEVEEWCTRLGLQLSPDSRVADLPLGVRQQIEILTCLAWGSRVLIVDEPTAVLSAIEADVVLDILARLRDEGVGILFVSHKMREVAKVADLVTVLRAGTVVSQHAAGAVDEASLAAAMIGEGRTVVSLSKAAQPHDRVRLRVASLTGEGLSDVTFEVRAGEVVALAGVSGNGQGAVVRAVCGLARLGGEVSVDGTIVSGSTAKAIEAGVALIPEDRTRDGLALSLPAWKNAIARATRRPEFSGKGDVLHRSRAVAFCRSVMARLRVKPANPTMRAAGFSGGNQQRLIVSRELAHAPAVVLAVEPTRGLDPAGAVEVAKALLTAAESGSAVLLVSSDLDELLTLAHRVLVLFRGRVAASFEPSDFNAERIGLAMAGALSS
jgi:simple sugar transport system ATP-binding protein